jgi:PAS domain S-box-containing protein
VQANEKLEARVRERTAQLRTSQEQLSEIVNESPDAIMVFGEPGTVMSANPAAERLVGRPASEMIGLNFADCVSFSPSEAERAYAAFNSALQGDERPPEEFGFVRGDGQTVIVEVMLRVVYGRNGERRMHAVIRDVTERDRMQKLKQAYEQRLREAERLESIGLLAGGVAHDFNNVLTMILSNVDLLQTWGDDPNSKALLGEIRHGSQQAANLTKQLLAFSRKQVLDVKPTDLGYVISNARKLFERAAGAHNRLHVQLPAEPMVVLVDATQIEQAIVNLLVNANHAMPDGGRVELSVSSMALDTGTDWPDAESGDYVCVAVTDTGTGMDEATRRRVFEPFFTTKELGHGTGLGLSSVHGVVKQAGGHIRVLSEPGRGSRFEILLPCHAAPAPSIPRHDSAVWSTNTGTVLVVEDQPQVRRALEHLLQSAGYHVLAAESGEDALAMVRKLNGRVDLLVSDIIMPGVSGIELSRRLLALYPTLAVLLVSGYAGSEFGALAELGEDVQFLQKPFDAASLSAAMRAALQRAAARAPQQAGTRDLG